MKDENAADAGEADKQASHPNGAGCNIVVEESADNGGEGAGQSPAQPINGHVAAAMFCRGNIGHIFAGGGDQGQFAEGENNHTQPEAPETAHEGHAARADGINQHAHANNRERFIPPRNAGDEILHEDTHQGVCSGNPTIEIFGQTKIGFGVHGQQNP